MLQAQRDPRLTERLAAAVDLAREGRADELKKLAAQLEDDDVQVPLDDKVLLGTLLAQAYANAQDYPAAQEAIDALRPLVPAARRVLQARFQSVAAWSAQGLHDEEQAIELGVRAVTLADGCPAGDDLFSALGNCALVFAQLQLFPLAVETGERAAAGVTAATGQPAGRLQFQLGYVHLCWAIRLEHLGLVEDSRTQWVDAVRRFDRALAAGNLTNLFRAWAAAWRSICVARMGRIEEAARDLELARRTPVRPRNPSVERAIQHAAATLLVAEGRFAEAETQLIACWGPTVEAGARVWTEDVAWLLGRVALSVGNHAEALHWHREMHERYGRAQYDAWMSRATAARLKVEQEALVRRTRELESDVLSDPLTGVPNRRAFDANLPRLATVAHASSTPLTLAIIDIDYFKRINDSFGHAVGDEVLRRVARVLREESREADRCARYGGDEMVLCLPVELAEATGALTRIAQSIAEHDWSTIAPGLAVTVSTGLAELAAGDTATTLFWAADQSLLTAKRARRPAPDVLPSVRPGGGAGPDAPVAPIAPVPTAAPVTSGGPSGPAGAGPPARAGHPHR
jgi:diguanylate cyclase (GGDEF)-like protein